MEVGLRVEERLYPLTPIDQTEPLKAILRGFEFENKAWSDVLGVVFAAKLASTKLPELYCETNTSTQVLLRFGLRVPKQAIPPPNGNKESAQRLLFDTQIIRKLALLLLAFEGEIDKLLANHTGYITQSVCSPPFLAIHKRNK